MDKLSELDPILNNSNPKSQGFSWGYHLGSFLQRRLGLGELGVKMEKARSGHCIRPSLYNA